jgi:hypothetical protein
MYDSSSDTEPSAFELVDFEHPTVKLPPLMIRGGSGCQSRLTVTEPPATVRRAVNQNTERPSGPFDPSPPPDTARALALPNAQPLHSISPEPEEMSWVAEQLAGVQACHEEAVVHAKAGVADPYAELRTALLAFVGVVGASLTGDEVQVA